MLHNNQVFNQDELRKVFAYFLNAKSIKQKFCRTNYGYRTYNSSWKVFANKNQIVGHKYIRSFEHGEYVNRLEEKVYKIVRNVESIDMYFVAERLI